MTDMEAATDRIERGDGWEELRKEARELGLGPSTLARMWILEHLRRLKEGRSHRERARSRG